MNSSKTVTLTVLQTRGFVRRSLVAEYSGGRFVDRFERAQLVIAVDLGWQVGKLRWIGLRHGQRILVEYVHAKTNADKETWIRLRRRSRGS